MKSASLQRGFGEGGGANRYNDDQGGYENANDALLNAKQINNSASRLFPSFLFSTRNASQICRPFKFVTKEAGLIPHKSRCGKFVAVMVARWVVVVVVGIDYCSGVTQCLLEGSNSFHASASPPNALRALSLSRDFDVLVGVVDAC